MTTTTKPYGWLKKIPASLLQQDQIPLIGHPPPFPWEELSEIIAQQLQLNNFSIKPAQAFEWRSEANLTPGLGNQLSILTVDIAPVAAKLHWVMPFSDVEFLMSLLLNPQSEHPPAIDPDLLDGFYHFMALEVISSLPQLNFDSQLSAHIIEKSELPKEPCLCLDVAVSVSNKTLHGCLVIPPELLQKWKERYAKRTVEMPIAEAIELVVHLEAGRLNFTHSEWSKVQPGDFLLPDVNGMTTQSEGTITLTVDNTPIYRGKLQDGNIKISEALLYHEVGLDMSTNTPDNHEEEEEDNHSQLEEELEENDDVFEDGDEEIEESDEEIDDDENEEEDEELLEDISEIEGLEPLVQDKWPPPPEHRAAKSSSQMTAPTSPAPISETDAQVSVTKAPHAKAISSEEIPLSIVIEVGRLQMSVQQLMELQPGNMLNLNVYPENGVDLVVNGRKVAKGELLLIGDTLGVRVLDIG